MTQYVKNSKKDRVAGNMDFLNFFILNSHKIFYKQNTNVMKETLKTNFSFHQR